MILSGNFASTFFYCEGGCCCCFRPEIGADARPRENDDDHPSCGTQELRKVNHALVVTVVVHISVMIIIPRAHVLLFPGTLRILIDYILQSLLSLS